MSDPLSLAEPSNAHTLANNWYVSYTWWGCRGGYVIGEKEGMVENYPSRGNATVVGRGPQPRQRLRAEPLQPDRCEKIYTHEHI